MSFQSAYNKSASRDIEIEPKDTLEIDIQKEELRKWLNSPFSRDLLLFLGKRELQLLNNARSAAKIDLKSEGIVKNLMKAVSYREVLEYLTENKKPEEKE